MLVDLSPNWRFKAVFCVWINFHVNIVFGARAVDTSYPRGGGQRAPFVWVFRRRKTLGFLVGRCSASANIRAGGKSDVGCWPFEMVTGWPTGYLKKSQLSFKKEHLMGIYVFVSALEGLIRWGLKKEKNENSLLGKNMQCRHSLCYSSSFVPAEACG